MSATVKDIEALIGPKAAEQVVKETRDVIKATNQSTFTPAVFVNDYRRANPGSYSEKWEAAIVMALDREFCLGNMEEWVRIQRSGSSIHYVRFPCGEASSVVRLMECATSH